MSDPSAGTSLPVRPPEDRLDSWKEIAAYLSRDVTTVQRWEKKEGMPVHRHLHDRMGSISASRAELDAWSRTRKLAPVKANEHQIPAENVATAPPGRTERSFFNMRKLLFALILTAAGLALVASLWLQRTEYFWKSPIGDARFRTITEAGGVELAATVSRDGHFVAFLSDRDGQMDVWVTQIGSGQFHNLTHGTAPGLVNPAVRNLGFSPDGSFVTFWSRRGEHSDIGIWAVPTLGGEPRPYMEDVSELDWSRNGSRVTYHTPAPGDPLFVSEGSLQSGAPPIFTAPAGLHSHFPLVPRREIHLCGERFSAGQIGYLARSFAWRKS